MEVLYICGHNGVTAVQKFKQPSPELKGVQTLADFYKGKGAQYKDAVVDFLTQHSGIK